MIATTLDTGLRPIEVGRARVQWVNLEDNELNIPKEESTKNEEYWNCTIKQKTAKALSRWLSEREGYDMYIDRDALWLTKAATTYNKDSFRTVFRNIAKEANLDLENRDLTPYSIRHSTATYVASEEGLAVAAEQCRHKSKRTPEKYEHSSIDRQKDAVNNID